MTGHVKVGGAWKSVSAVSAKVGGSWKTVSAAYTKIGGTWKQWYTAGTGLVWSVGGVGVDRFQLAALYSSGKYFVFGAGSTSLTSSTNSYSIFDGTTQTWSNATLPSSGAWGAVATNGSRIVLNNNSGSTSLYSDNNGTTWSTVTINSGGAVANGMIWDGSRFLLWGATQRYSTVGNGGWTSYSAGTSSGTSSLAWNNISNGIYIATPIGATSTWRKCVGDPTVSANWNNITGPWSDANSIIAYGNGVWVATKAGLTPATVPGSTENTYAYSTDDGATWTMAKLSAGPAPQYILSLYNRGGIQFVNGKFVTIAQTDPLYDTHSPDMWTSTDGVNWTFETVYNWGFGTSVAYAATAWAGDGVSTAIGTLMGRNSSGTISAGDTYYLANPDVPITLP